MSATAILTGLDLLIQLIDRTSAAAAVIKKAHSEGRAVTAEELAVLRVQLDSHLDALDAAIEQAKSEGR
jgi:phage I-like protein